MKTVISGLILAVMLTGCATGSGYSPVRPGSGTFIGGWVGHEVGSKNINHPAGPLFGTMIGAEIGRTLNP